jgi:hypothetical protein
MLSGLGQQTNGGLMGLQLPPTPQQIQQAQQAQAQAQQPQQGQDPNAPFVQKKTYNGKVEVEGKEVDVKNGQVEVEGHKFIVSANGEMVIDENGQFVGKIEDGKFVVADDAMIKDMTDRGLLQVKQPDQAQGAPQ